MATKTAIEEEIEKLVGTYSLWEIGITNDPSLREVEIGTAMGWRHFEADSDRIAKEIEAHFVDKGMHGDSGLRISGAKYVYIFMGLQARLEGRTPARETHSRD